MSYLDEALTEASYLIHTSRPTFAPPRKTRTKADRPLIFKELQPDQAR